MWNKYENISDELLAAFLDGNTTREETELVLRVINTDDVLMETVDIVYSETGESILWNNNFEEIHEQFSNLLDYEVASNNAEELLINNSMKDRFIIGENPIQQENGDTCAIKSQQLVMQDFGINATEDQLVQWSTEHGLYLNDGSGTQMGNVGVLLSEAGIPVTQTENANIFDLTNELAQGHKVIVGVDSGELWAKDRGIGEQIKEWWEDFWSGEKPDHALIVSSIDNHDPNHPQVVLTDPGSGEIRHYPLDVFMDAWKDSNCFMVSTDIAPAEFAATQIENNQPSQYLADIAGSNYNDFQIFHDMADALPPFNTWDYSVNSYHPVHSLMDAYFQYGQDAIEFSDLNQFDFCSHLDPVMFSSNFGETYNSGFNLLHNDYQSEMSGIQDYFTQNHDAASMHDYFGTQAQIFSDMGNTDLANFCEQQMHYIDFCQDIGVDPMDTYMLPL